MRQEFAFYRVGDAEILDHLLRIDAAETAGAGVGVGYFLLGEKRFAQSVGCADIGFCRALANGNPDAHAGQADPATPPAVVRYTHQQLAEMIGSYRETVTKAIGEFREAGLIRVEEDAIYLTDVARLRELVGR